MKLRRVAQAIAGTILGLAAVEAGFHARDHGAFPHLNLYRADERLGARLQPGATERISFSHNPVSYVRINAQGYRGADWPARADGEILVVGDSQAFGLGVDEEQAFASRLGKALGRPVANAAVPTYGPEEYDAVLAEELPRRKPRTVVYTINIANDLFEAAHPNRTRHAVWDGWAVRKETAPARVTSFPGRDWLFRRSHAFFAARGLWFARHGGTEEGAVPSEGGWQDLVSAGQTLSEAQASQRQAADEERARRDAALAQAQAELRKVDEALTPTLSDALPGEEVGPSTLRAARAHPGDIVRIYYGEGSRPVPAIALEIQRAAELRRRFVAALKAKRDDRTLAALAQHDALEDQVATLRAEPIGAVVRERSPLRPYLERARARCAAQGAELVVLVLPLDVQVSAEEWKKYPGATTADLSATRVLSEDVLTMAEELGARAVDAWPALAAAEPGAFLDGDLHMSEKGHAAVAAALAEALRRPGGPPRRVPPLPAGRSQVPSPAEWRDAPRLAAGYGLDQSDLHRFGCEARQLREWIKLSCKGGALAVTRTGRAEPLLLNTDDGASLVVAVLEGDRFSAFRFGKKSGPFTIEWPLGEPTFEGSFYDGTSRAAAPRPTDAERALCACHKQETGAADCTEAYGEPQEGCARAYAGQCRSLLACARGDASAPPDCSHGVQQISGVTRRCRTAAAGEPTPRARRPVTQP